MEHNNANEKAQSVQQKNEHILKKYNIIQEITKNDVTKNMSIFQKNSRN